MQFVKFFSAKHGESTVQSKSSKRPRQLVYSLRKKAIRLIGAFTFLPVSHFVYQHAPAYVY